VESSGGGVDGGGTLGGVIDLWRLEVDLDSIDSDDGLSDTDLFKKRLDFFFRWAEGTSGVVKVGGGVRGN